MAHGTCDFVWVVRYQDASGRIRGGAKEVLDGVQAIVEAHHGSTFEAGEPRPTIEIVLVATLTDEMDAAWRSEGNDRRLVQVELYEADVRELLALVEHRDAGTKIGDRLRLSLEVLP